MRTLFASLVLVLFAGVAFGEGKFTAAYPAESGSGGVSIPGLSGTSGNDLTLDHVMALKQFSSVPEGIKWLAMFSTDAGGDFSAVGVDTNPCTEEEPCLSFDKCEEVLAFGGACVWDQQDTAETLANEFNNNTAAQILSTRTSTGTSGVFSGVALGGVFSSSILYGVTNDKGGRFTIDCTPLTTTASGSGLIQHNPGATGNEDYLAVGGIQFENCPEPVSPDGDTLRIDANGAIVGVNIRCIDVVGANDQCFTAHSAAGGGGSILINFGGTIADSANTSNFWQPVGGSNALIGFDIENNLASSSGQLFILGDSGGAVAGLDTDLLILGGSLAWNNDPSAGAQNQSGLNLTPILSSPGISYKVQLARTAFIGDWGGSSTGAIRFSSSGANTTDFVLRLFQNTFKGTHTRAGNNAPLYHNLITNGSTVDVRSRCNNWDGQPDAASYIVRFENSDGTTDYTLDFQDEVYDDDEVTNAFHSKCDGTGHDYADVAAAIASGECFEPGNALTGGTVTAFFNDALSTDTSDSYQALADQAACGFADCDNNCSSTMTFDMPAGVPFIPSSVAGAKIRSFNLGTHYKSRGAR